MCVVVIVVERGATDGLVQIEQAIQDAFDFFQLKDTRETFDDLPFRIDDHRRRDRLTQTEHLHLRAVRTEQDGKVELEFACQFQDLVSMFHIIGGGADDLDPIDPVPRRPPTPPGKGPGTGFP